MTLESHTGLVNNYCSGLDSIVLNILQFSPVIVFDNEECRLINVFLSPAWQLLQNVFLQKSGHCDLKTLNLIR